MQKVNVKRHFDAPVEEVWAVYSDHAGWKHWAGFSRSWIEKEGAFEKNGVGCVRGFGSPGIEVFEEVLEWEPPKRMAYSVIRGGLPMKDHYGEAIFEKDGDGTLLTWRCRFESGIPGLGWLLRLVVHRVFRTGLDGLARRYFPDR
jgi:uncharacterized protein YndB with AHSA1/START domain